MGGFQVVDVNGNVLSDDLSLANAGVVASMLSRSQQVSIYSAQAGLLATTYYPVETLVYGRIAHWFGSTYYPAWVVEESRLKPGMGTHGLAYVEQSAFIDMAVEMHYEFNYPLDVYPAPAGGVCMVGMESNLVHYPHERLGRTLYRVEDMVVFKR